MEPMPGFRHPEDNIPQACQLSLTSEPHGSLFVITHRGWVGYHTALILFQHLLFLAVTMQEHFFLTRDYNLWLQQGKHKSSNHWTARKGLLSASLYSLSPRLAPP